MLFMLPHIFSVYSLLFSEVIISFVFGLTKSVALYPLLFIASPAMTD